MSLNQLVRNQLLSISNDIVSFYACRLPNPATTDYSELLIEIKKILAPTVQKEYTLLMYTASLTYQPSYSWLISAYSSMSREYRKNLKKLYIVHPSSFGRFIFTAFSTITSPKFAAKMVWIEKLGDLPPGLTSITGLPKEILDHDQQQQRISYFSSWFSISSRLPCYPCDIVSWTQVPPCLIESASFITTHGLKQQGLFRISPNALILKQAKEAFNVSGKYVFTDVHVACACIKTWFRELKEPVFTLQEYNELNNVFINDKIQFCRQTISKKAIILQKSLKCAFAAFHETCLNQSTTLMGIENIVIVVSPNLVKSSDIELDFKMASPSGAVGVLVATMIEYFDLVFKDVE